MRRVVLTLEAEDALQDIAIFTSERWGAEQAREYLARMRAACLRLCENPGMGRLRRKIGAVEFREIQIGSHIVVYVLRPTDILVVGVLHEAMDIPARRRALVRRMRSRGLI